MFLQINRLKVAAALGGLIFLTATSAQAEEPVHKYQIYPIKHSKCSCGSDDCVGNRSGSNARSHSKRETASSRRNSRVQSRYGIGNGHGHETGAYANGNCPPNGYANCPCPECKQKRHCLSGLCRRCCHHSPGHGWRPPNQNPIQRNAVGYTKYFPTYWSGNGPGQPVYAKPAVYTPTDTTQLGYYYNRVPSWQPRPGMLPPMPIPSNFHDRTASTYHRNHYWGWFPEGHKWRHKSSYSQVPSVGYGNMGEVSSSCPGCPNCQGGLNESSSYPTPVSEGSTVDMESLKDSPMPLENPQPYDDDAPEPKKIQTMSLSVPNFKSELGLAVPTVTGEPSLLPISVPAPAPVKE